MRVIWGEQTDIPPQHKFMSVVKNLITVSAFQACKFGQSASFIGSDNITTEK